MLVCKPAMSSALLFPYLVFLSLMASGKLMHRMQVWWTLTC
jgi:hypothetical protein